MSVLGEFGSAANRLSRNPLGIIALFIVLLYGIAGLVLGTTADNFGAEERRPLIWFLVLFPLVVLIVFAWLVSRHHQKLYAPGDYKTDDAFLKSLSPEAQRRRLDEEVQQIAAAEAEEKPSRPQVVREGQTLDHSDVPAKVPRIERYLHQANLSRYRTEAVLAEDLVLRQLESEYGVPVRRQAAVKQGDTEVHLDGLVVLKGKIIGVEVKIFREGALASLTNRISEIAATAARLGSMTGASMVAAIVGVGLSDDSRKLIKSRFDSMLGGIKTPVDVRFYDFNELQRLFGVARDSE